MRLIGAWILAAGAVLASWPARAQSDPLGPLPQPAQSSAVLQPVSMQPVQTYVTRPIYAAPTGFDAYKLYLAGRARSAGIREATIQANVLGLDLNRRAIQLDQSQPGGPPNSSLRSWRKLEPAS